MFYHGNTVCCVATPSLHCLQFRTLATLCQAVPSLCCGLIKGPSLSSIMPLARLSVDAKRHGSNLDFLRIVDFDKKGPRFASCVDGSA